MKEINLDKEIEKAQKKLDELIEQKSKQRSELQSDLVDQLNSLAEKIGLNDQFSLKVVNRTALYHGEPYSKAATIKLVSSTTGTVYRTFDAENGKTEDVIENIEASLNRDLDRFKLIDQIVESTSDVESIDHKPQYTRLILLNDQTIDLNFSLFRDAVEVSVSEQIAADKEMISIKLDEDLSLVVEDNNLWSTRDLTAKIESKPIKCELTFESINNAIEQSLMQLNKINGLSEPDFQLFQKGMYL